MILIFGFLAVILGSLTKFVLWPILITGWQAYQGKDEIKIFWSAMGLGILTDLVAGRTLGLTAIFLLVCAEALIILRTKYQVNFWAIAGMLGFFELVYYCLVKYFGF